ncbi:MAG TPA: hypothetical protein VGR26_15405 [Acidimicrobiales bacterium]|nr:hypothetical protein [Acidimicrobiales bacterium]
MFALAIQLCSHAELAQRIQAVYDDSRVTYGWPRGGLRREGVHASR